MRSPVRIFLAGLVALAVWLVSLSSSQVTVAPEAPRTDR